MNLSLPVALASVGALGGVTMAIPLGPAGLSCASRTAREGLRAGLLAGASALAVDALYAAIAVTTFVHFGTGILAWRDLLRVIAGAIIGVMVLRRRWPAATPSRERWASPAVLTLANPAAIAVFTAILAAAGLDPTQVQGIGWWWLMMGATAGAALWWFAVPVATWASRLGHSERALSWMTRATLLVAGGLAVVLLALGGIPLVTELLGT